MSSRIYFIDCPKTSDLFCPYPGRCTFSMCFEEPSEEVHEMKQKRLVSMQHLNVEQFPSLKKWITQHPRHALQWTGHATQSPTEIALASDWQDVELIDLTRVA